MYECMKLKCVCNVGVSVSVPENPLSLSLSVRVLANVRHLIFSSELERFHDFQTLCQMLERIRLWNPSKCALIIYTTDRIWSEIHEQTITINAILLIVFMRVFTLPPFSQSPKLSSYHILRRFSFFCSAMDSFTRENLFGRWQWFWVRHTKHSNQRDHIKCWRMIWRIDALTIFNTHTSSEC